MIAMTTHLLSLWALGLTVLLVSRWRQRMPPPSLHVLFGALVVLAVWRSAWLQQSGISIPVGAANSSLSFIPRELAPIVLSTVLLAHMIGGRAAAASLMASASAALALCGLLTAILLGAEAGGAISGSWPTPFDLGSSDRQALLVAIFGLAAGLVSLYFTLNRLGRTVLASTGALVLLGAGWIDGLVAVASGVAGQPSWSRLMGELAGWALAFLVLSPLALLSLRWFGGKSAELVGEGGAVADSRSDSGPNFQRPSGAVDQGRLALIRQSMEGVKSGRELLQAGAELLAEAAPIEACWIGLVRQDGGGLRAVARAGSGWLQAPPLERFATASGELITAGEREQPVDEHRLHSWVRSHPQHEALLRQRQLSWQSLPLGSANQRWGVLVTYQESGVDAAAQATWLALAAQELGLGLERWQRAQVDSRRIRLLDGSLEALAQMVSQTSLSGLLEVVVSRAFDLLEVELAEVFLRDPESDSLRLAARLGESTGAEAKGSSLEQARTAIERGEPIAMQTAEAGGSDAASWTILSAPLMLGERTLGSISVGRDGWSPFTNEQREGLAVFARQVALSLDNLERLEAERQRSAELETLRQASLNLTASLELESVLESILEQTLQVVSAFDAHIFLYDGERLSFGAALWASGAQREPFAEPREHGLTYTVARSGERIVIEEASSHPLFDSAPWQWNGAIIGMPLRAGDRVLGVMNVAFEEPHEFAEEELHLLGLLADQAALVLENARLFDRTAGERRRLRLLYDNARALAATLDPDEVLQRAVELTTENLGGLIGTVNLIDHETGRMYLGAMAGLASREMAEIDKAIDQRVGKGLVGWVAETAHAALSNDVAQDDRWRPVPGVDDEVRSALAAPIFVGGQLMGVMAIFHHEAGVFLDEHSELLTAICQQTSLAWSNAQRYRQIERRLAEGTALQQVAQVINSRLEMEPLLKEIVEQVSGVLGYPVVDIVLVEGDELVLRAGVGADSGEEVRMGIDAGVIGRVVRSGKPAIVPDVSRDPDYIGIVPPASSEIAVPLHKGDVVIGVLNVEAYQVGALDGEDLRLLTLLADQVSVAIENAALYDRLRRHSEELEAIVGERTAELSEALAKAQEADRLKTQFVSDVSHELRTPLSNIQLYVELLERAKEARRPDYLDTLARETDRLVALIEDLLSISRLDADSMPMEFRPLDLNELSAALVDDRRRLFSEKGLSLRWLPSQQQVFVRADTQLLSQVIANLMTNAMHYTPRGGDVKVKTEAAGGDNWVKLSVEDTGLGIPEGELDQLFTRFFRGSASRQMGTPGTGLGLAICKEIIDRHQGRIAVESDPGEGSKFTVWLPKVAEPAGDAGQLLKGDSAADGQGLVD